MTKAARILVITVAGVMGLSIPLFAQADLLKLVKTTPIENVQGDFDHFVVDINDGQLFVSAEKSHRVEIFNFDGDHLGFLGPMQRPNAVAYDSHAGVVVVGDGGSRSLSFYNGKNHELLKQTDLGVDPDPSAADAENHLIYIGYGGKDANLDYSYIGVISTSTMAELTKIQVPSASLKGMAIDHQRNRLYVNMRDEGEVGIVDLNTRIFVRSYKVPGLNLNTPLKFDRTTQRLVIAGRRPGKLFILEPESGKVVQEMDCTANAYDLTLDLDHHRIFLTGEEGIQIFEQSGPESYKLISELQTNYGKTSIYVPTVHRLFTVTPERHDNIPSLKVYDIER
jgi:hypothetical protein